MDNIATGFRAVNRNWQLVVLQAVMIVLLVLTLFLFLIPPILASVMVADLDSIRDFDPGRMAEMLENPARFVSEYIGLIAITLVSILAYATAALLLWVFIFGGSAGVLGRHLEDPLFRFGMKAFLAEGKRLFWPLTGYMTVLSLALLGVAVLFAVMGLAGYLSVEAFTSEGSSMRVFLIVLGVLSAVTVLVGSTFLFYCVVVIGMGPLVLDASGPMESLDKGIRFLLKRPGSLWMLALLFGGYVGIQIAASTFVNLLQLVGLTLLSIPFQLALNVLSGYLSLVVLASVLAYYRSATSGSSSAGCDISAGEAPRQAPPPGGSDRTVPS